MQKKFSAYLILLLLTAGSLAARQAGSPWVTYTPPSKKFTVMFPAQPKADHQTISGGGFITEVDTYISISSDNGIFSISYMHLNPQGNPSADAALKTAQDELLQTGGAKLLTSKKTDYLRGPNDRLPMLEFTGENDMTAVRGSAILDTDHVYTVATLCPKGQDCYAGVAKFFSSFKLAPRQ